MDKPEIRKRLLDLLSRDLERAGVAPAAVENDLDLLDAGIVDSFGFINLSLRLEETFGILLDIAEFDDEALYSVGGLVALIAERRAETSG